MTLQDHNTINELIKFYLKANDLSDMDNIHKLMISNAIEARKKDLNIY